MPRPEILLFDANETLFDLAPLQASVAKALGGDKALASTWFPTLLQHSLVANVTGHYRPFDEIAAACLVMLARGNGIDLDDETAKAHLAPMSKLPPHPDVAPALTRLRSEGYRLAILTNSPKATLLGQVEDAGLAHAFVELLSVDEIRTYKPAAETYHWAARRVGADPAACCLVAAHGWDIAGAAWVGLKTAFLARPGKAPYGLAPEPDLRVDSLAALPEALATLG